MAFLCITFLVPICPCAAALLYPGAGAGVIAWAGAPVIAGTGQQVRASGVVPSYRYSLFSASCLKRPTSPC